MLSPKARVLTDTNDKTPCMLILSLAIPTPLRRSFDYLPPAGIDEATLKQLQPGIRVKAPFGNRQVVGILLAIKEQTELDPNKLKAVCELLDDKPILPPRLLSLCQWASTYYQHPGGDALANSIPGLLRKGEPLIQHTERHWRLSTEGKGLPIGALKRSTKQALLLERLQQQDHVSASELEQAGISRAIAKALVNKGLAVAFEAEAEAPAAIDPPPQQLLRTPSLALNSEQQTAVDAINESQLAQQSSFQCYLLEGVTGSGKTEVYLQLIERCLQLGRQALVLIPEIGLTPQTLSRFQQRFNCPVAAYHSGLTDRERLLSWQQATSGEAGIVIGTRSAVFSPLAKPGLIIIDEEHDSSFKQQEGFRYSARDVAIKRAASEHCPIVLGSATPSLETLHNALQGRYRHLTLKHRATGAAAPRFELMDIRHAPLEEGFSPLLLQAIHREIKLGNQVLVFINRRGFAPVLMCHDCGYIAQCSHCDARMTVHYRQQMLRCHHCEQQTPLPKQCPNCHSRQIDFHGSGTERSEQALNRLFPDTEVIRIDRDTTSRKAAMQQLTDDINRGDPCILVGTQMLAKGHHFADVTLVAILDADGGLFSADFRGLEKTGQLLTQVAGRAGRESKPGTVIIQTHQPEHPLLNCLLDRGYHHFARQLLNERHTLGLPPFSQLALVRAEAGNLPQPETFLHNLRDQLQTSALQYGVALFGPLPAPMTRKAGRYRVHLLLRAEQRKNLHFILQQLIVLAEQQPSASKLRWSIDVDPIEIF